MSQYKTILVPTDFSDASRDSLRHAAEWLAPGGEILVCHVVDDTPMTYGYVGMSPTVNDLRTQMAQAAAEELEGFVSDLEATVRTYILHGAPHKEICKLAEKKSADLIVMSTHGRSGVTHLLLGSVAEHVVQKAPCAVLVLRNRDV